MKTVNRLIDLFDEEYPLCLYCHAEIIETHGTEQYPHLPWQVSYVLYTCNGCGERFNIRWLGDGERTEDSLLWISCTCRDMTLQQYKSDEKLSIFSHRTVINPVVIPFFVPDFSNRQKLHDKLSTYLVFS